MAAEHQSRYCRITVMQVVAGLQVDGAVGGIDGQWAARKRWKSRRWNSWSDSRRYPTRRRW
ncbi:MAG: hypothetical protein U5K79_23200 [Cyclobacteriaceae bacterium]|nr:hypothetical protein [Cyclobacteriaceae bacterium]